MPSQTRPATHSVAANSLNRCQRVMPSTDAFRQGATQKCKKTPRQGRLHSFPFSLKEVCWELGDRIPPLRYFFNAISPVDGDLTAARARNTDHDGILALVIGEYEIAVIGFAGEHFCPARAAGAGLA